MNQNNLAIGVFDSGMGGLSVAQALKQALPRENFIFIADSAHLPYGDRSAAELAEYSQGMADFLAKQPIKALVIACNTVSSLFSKQLSQQLNIPVVNVIDPLAAKIGGFYQKPAHLGLVGTALTIKQGYYADKITSSNPELTLSSWAMPELVPMIEQKPIQREKIFEVILDYAKRYHWEKLDGLILGCTHYPWVYQEFRAALDRAAPYHDVTLWHANLATANSLKELLAKEGKLNGAEDVGSWHFYLTQPKANLAYNIQLNWEYEPDLIQYLNWSQKGDKLCLTA